METISELLPYAQVVLSILLIGAIILQQTGSSLGGAFGGDNFSAGFHKRRGFEKLLFNATDSNRSAFCNHSISRTHYLNERHSQNIDSKDIP